MSTDRTGAPVGSSDLAAVLAEVFDATGGPPTEQGLEHAGQRLADAEQR